MRRMWLFLLVLSLGLNAGLLYNQFTQDSSDGEGRRGRPPAAVEGRPARGEMSPEQLVEGRLARMTEALQLDDEQRQQMRIVLRETVPVAIEHRNRVAEAREQMVAELSAPTVDPERVRALAASLTAAQAQVDSLIAESLIREIVFLTPEQRAQYVEHLPVPGGRRRRTGKP